MRRSAWIRRLGLAAVTGLLALASSAGATGCASPREDINRVQPLALNKNDFVGDFRNPEKAPEFYMRSLITQVQRTNPWFSDGLQDLTRRVRFEITERYLIARNAYEYVANTDGRGLAVKANGTPDGQPAAARPDGYIVAMWPITSHFNVQRQYNPSTGEPTNVIEENATDVPWQDREYMRVDWSRNLVGDPNQIFWFDSFGGDLQWKPVAYFDQAQHTDPNDPKNDIGSHFDELSQGYFDITSKWLAAPAAFDYYGYQVPYCLLQNFDLYPGSYSEGSIECSDQEVTLRTAFWKVPTGDQSTDYEVHEIGLWDQNIIGNLKMDRSGYDRNYGIVDETWHTYLMRYNIWQKSHKQGAVCGASNLKADGDAECIAADPNSRCDMNAKLCTLPYEQRTVRPIAFYLDQELPERLHPQSQNVINEWNLALKRAVSYAREVECRKLGGDRATCHEKYFAGAVDITKEDEPTGDDVVVLCHNPVVESDNRAACGPVGKRVRKGDIRHHMIGWWNNPSFRAPLGVIVWSGDPTTGENIGTIANVFGGSLETYAARFRDWAALINGDITPEEYVNGITRDWYGDGGAPFPNDPTVDPVLNSYQQVLNGTKKKQLALDEIKARIAAIDPKKIRAEMGIPEDAFAKASAAERIAMFNEHAKKHSTMGTPGYMSGVEYTAKIGKKVEALQKSGLEPKVMNDLWLSSMGVDPKFAGEQPVLDGLSPLRGMNPTLIAQQAMADFEAKRSKHMCSYEKPEMLSFAFIAGSAALYKAKYPDGATVPDNEIAKAAGVAPGTVIDRVVRGKLVFQEVLDPIYGLTTIHEIGHLMSMEHDFQGSWDSPNFFPEYWTLRANGDKANMAACADVRTGATDNCMGPRFLDPATPDELGTKPGAEHHSIESYAVASVMDYKPDADLGPIRLGQADKMAAKFIYTRIGELFDHEFGEVPNVRKAQSDATGALTLMNSESWIIGGNVIHYTELARKLNLFEPKRCRPQTEEEKAKGIGALGLTCAPVHKDHAFIDDLAEVTPPRFPPWDDGFKARYAVLKNPDGTEQRRWPYKVGDGRLSYVHGYWWDTGADFYEITQDVLDRYNLMYLDYFFRAKGRERNISRAGASMQFRFFDRVQSLQWNALSDVVRNGGIEGAADVNDQGVALALTDLFDTMQSAFLRPQPGAYKLNKQPGSMYELYSALEDTSKPGDFSVGVGDARYVDHKFDLTKQFDYRAYALRAGSFLEKPYAAIALTDGRPQLSTVARETYLDGRNVVFSFRSALPEAFDRLIAGVMADDWDTVAPFIAPDATKDSFGMSPLSTMKLWETDAARLSAARPAGAKLVDPMLGYRQKLPAIVLMMLYQPIDSSMDLINRTRIWVPGSAEAVGVPEGEKVVFFDPVEGVEWNAKSFGTEVLAGKVVDKGIGARMMEHANELLTAAFDVETEVVAGTQVKVKYGADHRPLKKGTTTAITMADLKDPVAGEKLRQYVGFLNQVRVALYYLGFGPCGFTYEREC